jgi:apolipoprotein D and lipocalin family protein
MHGVDRDLHAAQRWRHRRTQPLPQGIDRATNAKLEVSFFRPFWGDYWIIDLGRDYEYAVVGHPSRDYLWILSRTPTMDTAVYDAIVARLRAQGYEVERLNRTLQPNSVS